RVMGDPSSASPSSMRARCWVPGAGSTPRKGMRPPVLCERLVYGCTQCSQHGSDRVSDEQSNGATATDAGMAAAWQYANDYYQNPTVIADFELLAKYRPEVFKGYIELRQA